LDRRDRALRAEYIHIEFVKKCPEEIDTLFIGKPPSLILYFSSLSAYKNTPNNKGTQSIKLGPGAAADFLHLSENPATSVS